MPHSRGFQNVFRQFKVGRVLVRVLDFFSAGQAAEEFRVFLIGEVVGGDVVRSGADGFPQRIFPDGKALPRNGDHEVHVDVGHSGVVEHLHGAEGLFRRMFPAQQAQDAGVQGLDAQGNAVHAQAAPEADFFFRKGSRIGFKGEFVQAVHGDQPVQGFHEVPQMRVRQHGGRPSSEVERGSLAAAPG